MAANPSCSVCGEVTDRVWMRCCPDCGTAIHPLCSDRVGGCGRKECKAAGNPERRRRLLEELRSQVAPVETAGRNVGRGSVRGSSFLGPFVFFVHLVSFVEIHKLARKMRARAREASPWLDDDPRMASRWGDTPDWMMGSELWNHQREPSLLHGVVLGCALSGFLGLGFIYAVLSPGESWLRLAAILFPMILIPLLPMMCWAHAQAWIAWREHSLLARIEKIEESEPLS